MLTLTQLRQPLASATCLAALLLFCGDSASALGVQDRGQREQGQQREKPVQGGAKDRPAQGGARDKPARGGAQDRPAKGGVRDKPGHGGAQDRPAKGAHGTKDERVRDQPAPHGQRDGARGAGHETPPRAETERGREQVRDGVGDRVTDGAAGGGERGAQGRAVADAARTKQIHGLERSHRRRVARIERLKEVYREQGDTAKLAELEGMLVRQEKLYKGKLAAHEKDLGAEQLERVLRDLPTRDQARGQTRQSERGGRGVTDKVTDKPTDRPTDKPTDRPADRPTDRPTDKQTDKPVDRPGGRQRSTGGDR